MGMSWLSTMGGNTLVVCGAILVYCLLLEMKLWICSSLACCCLGYLLETVCCSRAGQRFILAGAQALTFYSEKKMKRKFWEQLREWRHNLLTQMNPQNEVETVGT